MTLFLGGGSPPLARSGCAARTSPASSSAASRSYGRAVQDKVSRGPVSSSTGERDAQGELGYAGELVSADG